MAIAYEGNGRPDEAEKAYQKSLELCPNDHLSYNNLGLIKKRKNEIEEAIACFKKALEIKPNMDMAFYNLGIIYKDKEDYEEAINYY